MAVRDQPDGMAASAGVGHLHLARITRNDPSRGGVGGHSSVSVLPALPPLRFLRGVGVFTRRDPGGAEVAPRRPVHVRVRPEHPVAARGQDRGGPPGSGAGQGIPDLRGW